MAKKDVIIIISIAGVAMLGIILNILACAIPKNWNPFFVVIVYALVAFPNLLCGMCNRGDIWGEGNRGWKNAGFFITAFLIVSGFGIPAVELHAGNINLLAFFLSIAGGFILYGAVLVYIHIFHGKKDDTF